MAFPSKKPEINTCFIQANRSVSLSKIRGLQNLLVVYFQEVLDIKAFLLLSVLPASLSSANKPKLQIM